MDKIEQKANELRGNWRKFESFAWHDQDEVDDPYNWGIVYTRSRDTSDPISLANCRVIDLVMGIYISGGSQNIREEHHSHWVNGWVDGYAIRIRDDQGNVTQEAITYIELALKAEDYPILDEDVYDDVLSELQEEAITNWIKWDYIRQLRQNDHTSELINELTDDQELALLRHVISVNGIDLDWDSGGITCDIDQLVELTTNRDIFIVMALTPEEATDNEHTV